jgi:hypothetical protein
VPLHPYTCVSERFLFDTTNWVSRNFPRQGYTSVSKAVSLSMYQYLTTAMSFDTISL